MPAKQRHREGLLASFRGAVSALASAPLARGIFSAALVGLFVFAARNGVWAEDARGAAAPGAASSEADVEMLRKLLGLPSRPEPPPPPPPAPVAPPPEPAVAPQPEPVPVAEPVAVPAPEVEKTPEPKSSSKKAPAPKAKPVPAKKPAPVKKAPSPKKPSRPERVSEPSAPVEAASPDRVEEAAPAAETAPPQAAPAAPAAAPLFSVEIPEAGTVVSAKNLDRWKHLMGPSIQWVVSRGATLPVIDATPAPIEPFREAATQRYFAQVKLTPDKTAMENYVAGIPFPLVTSEDPDVAVKMMFNFENRISIDDLDDRNFGCDTGGTSVTEGLNIERHYLIGHFRRIFYTSRFHNDPKPTWRTKDNVRYREMLYPLREPFDFKGSGFTYIRYLDPGRQDDSWLYFPQFKRVRRLSTAQRSEGVFGQDVDLDSYAGYAGNPAWTDWKFLGKKTVLASMHARNLPAKFQAPPVDFFPDDVWEPREVYILLGVSKLGGYNFGRRVIYLDRESLVIPYTEIYDLNGALWKSLVHTWKFAKTPMPGAKRAVYDYDQFYIPGFTLMDIQLDHATRCQFPSADEKGEEGWYYNFGAAEGTTEEAFAVSNFIESGR